MKKVIATCLAVCTMLLSALAQTGGGIKFEHGLSWQQVKEKAKAENKFIYVDCYTTWCGPCKAMAKNIFPQPKAGEYFNSHFINVKIQLDTTAKDNQEVKAWYQAGRDIAKEGEVSAFPTSLFFNPNGELVHRIPGAPNNVDEFIDYAKAARDTNMQYFTLRNKYKNGDRSPELLRNATYALKRDGNNKDRAVFIANQYIASQKNDADWFTKDNLEFLAAFTKSSGDKGFKIFLNYPEKTDSILGAGVANSIIMPIIATEEIAKKMDFNQENIAWDVLQSEMVAKYPITAPMADELMVPAKLSFFKAKSNKKKIVEILLGYMEKYGKNASAEELNNHACDIFDNATDKATLAIAEGWSKRAYELDPRAASMDTRANLLYKMGKKAEAIKMEAEAAKLGNDYEKQVYSETLAKMKKGVKTWP